MPIKTKAEALAHVLDIASRWGENAEEGFKARVTAEHTDEECAALADDVSEPDDVIEVRDLWLAIKMLSARESTRRFEARAKDKCGTHRCAADQPCPCYAWAKERVRSEDAIYEACIGFIADNYYEADPGSECLNLVADVFGVDFTAVHDETVEERRHRDRGTDSRA